MSDGKDEALVAGCDIGSATGKVVILRDEEIISWVIIPSTTKPERTAHAAMDEALTAAGLSGMDGIRYVVGTGYGRVRVPFADEDVSEITCHARGVHWVAPTVRTVIDIGGQDCKVVALDARGRVLDFVMNDKCAAGTGRFFEAMARVLDCGLEGLAELSLQSEKPATITSQCSVFAESEVITLVNEGVEVVDIAAGIHASIASRLSSLVRRVGLVEEVALSGGCAKNRGLVKALSEKLEVSIRPLPVDPQIAGALGAALVARERLAKQAQ